MSIPEGTVKSRLNKGLKILNRMGGTQLKELNSNESLY